MANSSLNISNATYGRSTSGAKIVTNNLLADIDKAYKVLAKDDKYYTDLVNTINKYWSGADANKFLKLLDDQRASIQNRIKKYKTVVQTVMEADRSSFEKAQSNVSNKISSSININKF